MYPCAQHTLNYCASCMHIQNNRISKTGTPGNIIIRYTSEYFNEIEKKANFFNYREFH